jgi:hypothetical protein
LFEDRKICGKIFAMAKLEVVVHLIPFGEPETGLWCDRCSRPSLIRQRIAVQSGMRVTFTPPMELCTDCDED